MAALMKSLIQILWNTDSWAAQLDSSGSLTLLLALSQAAAVLMFARWLQRMETSRQSMALGLVIGISLLCLLITPFYLSWLMLLAPTAMGLSAGYAPRAGSRWAARLLFLGSGLSALILGGVTVAAIVAAGIGAWLLGYISRQVYPFEAAPLSAGKEPRVPVDSLETN